MRILFVVKNEATLVEHLGLMYISAVLKEAGHETRGVAAADYEAVTAVMVGFRPHVVGFAMTTGVHPFHLDLARRLKRQFEFLSIFGGPHPTCAPEIVHEDGVDIVCVGEGEYPMLELVQHLQAGTDYRHIPNLLVNQGGDVLHNPPRPYLQDLDSLPFPDRELWGPPLRAGFAVIAKRGCPYECTYCFNHRNQRLAEGRYLRQRSVDDVIDEAVELRDRYGATGIYFQDDIFVLDTTWLREFAPRFRDEVCLPFRCHVRADLITGEIVALLKEGGCVAAAMGVETGNDELRNLVLKRRLGRDRIVDAGRRLVECGIELLTQNMIALPGETVEMAFETVEINVEIKPRHMNLYFYQPYPGTELARYAVDRGYFDGDFSDYPESYLARSSNEVPIRTPEAREFKLLADIFHLLVRFPALIPCARYTLTRKRETLTQRLWSMLLSVPLRVYSRVKVTVLAAMSHQQRQTVRRLLKV